MVLRNLNIGTRYGRYYSFVFGVMDDAVAGK